jgi:16S rRNA (uracil1498-N3)-methyltransferase
MEVAALADWGTYCVRGDLPVRRLLAHPGGAAPVRGGGGDCAVAVGPEGGFTDAEEQAARAAGWQPVGLGPRLLRVETAALVLAALAACGLAQDPRPQAAAGQ